MNMEEAYSSNTYYVWKLKIKTGHLDLAKVINRRDEASSVIAFGTAVPHQIRYFTDLTETKPLLKNTIFLTYDRRASRMGFREGAMVSKNCNFVLNTKQFSEY